MVTAISTRGPKINKILQSVQGLGGKYIEGKYTGRNARTQDQLAHENHAYRAKKFHWSLGSSQDPRIESLIGQ